MDICTETNFTSLQHLLLRLSHKLKENELRLPVSKTTRARVLGIYSYALTDVNYLLDAHEQIDCRNVLELSKECIDTLFTCTPDTHKLELLKLQSKLERVARYINDITQKGNNHA